MFKTPASVLTLKCLTPWLTRLSRLAIGRQHMILPCNLATTRSTESRRMHGHAEGRLEADGTLACSYHGWRFGPDGKCTMIPQVVTC